MTTSYSDIQHSSPDSPKLLNTGLITLPEAGGQEQSPGTTKEEHAQEDEDICPVGLQPDSRPRKRLWSPSIKHPKLAPPLSRSVPPLPCWSWEEPPYLAGNWSITDSYKGGREGYVHQSLILTGGRAAPCPPFSGHLESPKQRTHGHPPHPQ